MFFPQTNYKSRSKNLIFFRSCSLSENTYVFRAQWGMRKIVKYEKMFCVCCLRNFHEVVVKNLLHNLHRLPVLFRDVSETLSSTSQNFPCHSRPMAKTLKNIACVKRINVTVHP